jgi:predicted nucleic acid-binding Zn ribbon protein
MKQERYAKVMTLGEVVQASPRLKRLGVLEEQSQLKIYQEWKAVAGEAVARNTRPLRLKYGVLTVAVRSGVWMQELSLLKPVLLKKLQALTQDDSVKDLRLTLSDFDLGKNP